MSPRPDHELVERDAERRRLAELIAGSDGLILVEGEAGIGKTSLVRSALREVDRQVLVGEAHPVRAPFPLGPVLGALLGARFPGRSAMSSELGALRPLLPERAAELPPPGAERVSAVVATELLLLSLAPTVLVLEDVQWVDDDTVDLLERLLARERGQLAVVMTCRADEVAADAPLRRLLSDARVTQVPVPPLSVAGVATHAARILGEEVSDELSADLHERSAGIPFVLEEDVRLLREHGALTVPAGVAASVVDRASRLTAPARAFLDAAAVVGARGHVALAAAAAGLRGAAAACALEEAIANGLVRAHDRTFAFRHGLARAAIYDAIAAPRRRHLHVAVGEALPIGEGIHHYRRCGDPLRWIAAAEALADMGDGYRHLADLLDSGAVADGTRHAELACRLFWAAPAGAPEVARHLERALAHPDLAATTRGEVRLYAAWHGGRYADVHAALADLDERPELRALALASLGSPMRTDVTAAARSAYLAAARAAAERSGDAVAHAYVAANAAWAMVAEGDPGAWAALDALLDPSESAPVNRQRLRGLRNGVSAAVDGGHYGRAIEIAAAATRFGETVGCDRYEPDLRCLTTLAAWSIGRLGAVEAETATLADDDALVRGEALLAQGAIEPARETLQLVAERQLARGEVGRAARATAGLLRIAAATGDDARARELAEAILDGVVTSGLWIGVAPLLPFAPVDLVAAVIDRYRVAVDGLDVPLAAAAVRFAEGRIAEDAGDLSTAADAYIRARYRYGRIPQPRLAALAAEAVGRVSASTGAYRDAQRIYVAIADTWEENRVKQAMRKLGVGSTHRAGRRGYGEELSPREREVADLVIQGHTNSEIADRLFLSPRTVETHVARILRKLQVTSRRELPRRYAASVATAGTRSRRPSSSPAVAAAQTAAKADATISAVWKPST